MATSRNSFTGSALAAVLLAGGMPVSAAAAGTEVDVPEVPVIAVTPEAGKANNLLPDWEQPRRPPTLGSRERQAILQQVSGGGSGGVPLMNNINTMGRTPTLRQAILNFKRPWFNHRAFLSAEGVQRVDARSVMRFDESVPGRAIVGVNLLKDTTYLIDFLVQGEGEGDYVVTTATGTQLYPDAGAKLNHVLIAVRAQANGWTEVSLSRTAGAFDLHTVEITLARGPDEEQPVGNE